MKIKNWLTCVQSGRMSLRRPKPPIKGGSAPEEEEGAGGGGEGEDG